MKESKQMIRHLVRFSFMERLTKKSVKEIKAGIKYYEKLLLKEKDLSAKSFYRFGIRKGNAELKKRMKLK